MPTMGEELTSLFRKVSLFERPCWFSTIDGDSSVSLAFVSIHSIDSEIDVSCASSVHAVAG